MDELAPRLKTALDKLNYPDGIRWVPVRHHSPACAYYLLTLLKKYNPDTVLIEGSIDFNAQLDALGHFETRPPVALYGGMGFFPLCDTSPEWQALRWAIENKKNVRFIDLPINDKAWKKENLETGKISFIHEARLQHSEYVDKLVNNAGCRNSDELWERWFELKEFNSAEDFFDRVFEYCTSARLTYSPESILDSEDSVREAFMSQQIRENISTDKETFIITGGFHTYALLDYEKYKEPCRPVKSIDKTKLEQSWIIRYSQDRLDANNGYSAGMPVPDYYERLFNYRVQQKSSSFSTELMLDTLAILERSSEFSLPINTAAKLAVCQQALSLSGLRGHCWPGLFDTLDALQSVLVKHESVLNDSVLVKARKVLAGNKLGSINTDQPPLPLVNEVYQKLKSARFKLESTTKVSTNLSLYKSKNTARMNLLYQCQFLQLEFANKVSGPDWIRGSELHLRHEEWQYAWTPWVEANLVDLSMDGGDWDALLVSRINQRKVKLEESSLEEYQQFFVQLVLMGSISLAAQIWGLLEKAISDTTDTDQLTKLLFLLMRLRHTESALFDDFSGELEELVTQVWQQLMFSLPNINRRELDDALTVLLQVQELTQEFEGSLKASWKNLWVNQLNWLVLHGELSPGLLYACRSILAEMGLGNISEILKAIEGLFDVDDKACYEALCAILKVVPHWLKAHGEDNILSLLNRLISKWSEERFLESLPELRFLFSHLDPDTIEQVSARLCQLNNWEAAPDVFDYQVDERQLIQAQKLQGSLKDHLIQEGLGHWISN